MTKIYLVRGSLTSLTILEAELIKKTPEQIHVDRTSVKVAWRARPDAYIPYISTRLQRHRENHFDSLLLAVEFAIDSLKKNLETAVANTHTAQLLLAELVVLTDAAKEASHAG